MTRPWAARVPPGSSPPPGLRLPPPGPEAADPPGPGPAAPSAPTADRGPGGGVPARVLVWVGGLAAAIGVLLDQITKQMAETLLVPGRMVEVLGSWFGWQLTYNQGGAFGLPAPSWFFLVVTVIVVVVVVRSLPRAGSIPQALALGLLLAGATGNALDRVLRPGGPMDPRFLHGFVVDFVALELPVVGSWPRFNVADASIVSGFLILLGAALRDEGVLEPESPQPRPWSPPESPSIH